MGGIFKNRKDKKVKAERKVRYKPALLHENIKCSSYSEELGYATQHLCSAALISFALISMRVSAHLHKSYTNRRLLQTRLPKLYIIYLFLKKAARSDAGEFLVKLSNLFLKIWVFFPRS